MLRPFTEVDVFTATPYHGNALAVVLDGEGLTPKEMQRFASWTNLAETTFLLPPSTPEADYRVRIFTATEELPFAGHPTLGTCHAWLEAGGVPRTEGEIVQECGAGLVRVRRTGDGLAFQAPPLLRSGPVEEPLIQKIADALGIGRADIVDAEWADNGPGWVAVLLADAESVLALRPGLVPCFLGVAGPYPEGAPYDFEVRAFTHAHGSTIEDPVTGSFNASLAQWLLRTGRAKAPYVASQGTVLDRSGRVHISTDEEGNVWVSGSVVTCVTGQAEL
ncbi:PhzF family phenazine biosynthesis protein [Nonomuraea sp. NPDC049400]|uniref:PhzF family phenazine biosynthesis protein n=1 Tax=Nonomuraea sp. NPDC049400 TaxID=3364352 RepID=UPI0037A16E33